ncbi:hypothetical protein [Parvibaculum sp. MBR-TMA-1.3b-4.2]|jgi:fatty acid desaturase
MTVHRLGALPRSRENAIIEEAGVALPPEGLWAAIGLIAAVAAPLVFGWGATTLPAVLFLVLCPFVVAVMLIADVAPAKKSGDAGEGSGHARDYR